MKEQVKGFQKVAQVRTEREMERVRDGRKISSIPALLERARIHRRAVLPECTEVCLGRGAGGVRPWDVVLRGKDKRKIYRYCWHYVVALPLDPKDPLL